MYMFFHAMYRPYPGVKMTTANMTGKHRNAVITNIPIMIGAKRMPIHQMHAPNRNPHWKFSFPTKKSYNILLTQ